MTFCHFSSPQVATKFRTQLNDLMAEVLRTSVQYVRCIKPNEARAPGQFVNALVCEQLRCAGPCRNNLFFIPKFLIMHTK
jgi:myosin heavy subunit